MCIEECYSVFCYTYRVFCCFWNGNNHYLFYKGTRPTLVHNYDLQFTLVIQRFRSKKNKLFSLPLFMYFGTCSFVLIHWNRFAIDSWLTFTFLDEWMIAKRENSVNWSDLSPMGFDWGIDSKHGHFHTSNIHFSAQSDNVDEIDTAWPSCFLCYVITWSGSVSEYQSNSSNKYWDSVFKTGSRWYCLTVNIFVRISIEMCVGMVRVIVHFQLKLRVLHILILSIVYSQRLSSVFKKMACFRQLNQCLSILYRKITLFNFQSFSNNLILLSITYTFFNATYTSFLYTLSLLLYIYNI